jgi:hypothetical protein
VFFTHIVENKLTPRQLGWGGIYKWVDKQLMWVL